jgi:predicted nucleotidyltransferase
MHDTEELCNNLELNDVQVLNIYLFGSRVYGTHRADSDYDFLIVVRDRDYLQSLAQKHSREEFMVNNRKQFTRVLASVENISASIYDLNTFLQLLHEHVTYVLCCVFYVRKEFVWRQRYTPHFTLRSYKLCENASAEANRVWYRAFSRITKEGDILRGQKLFAYTFRYLNWALQLHQQGCITDITFGNDHLAEAIKLCEGLEVPKEIHKALCTRFQEEYNSLQASVTALVPKPFLSENLHESQLRFSQGSLVLHRDAYRSLLQYIRENDLKTLTRDYSVCVTEISDDTVRLDIESCGLFPFISVCNGTVINIKTREYACVAVPKATEIIPPCYTPEFMIKARDHSKRFSIKNDDQCMVFDVYIQKRKPSSRIVYLYWNSTSNQWRISQESEFMWVQQYDEGLSHVHDLSELFWEIWNSKNYTIPDTHDTFVFNCCIREKTLKYLYTLQWDGNTVTFNHSHVSNYDTAEMKKMTYNIPNGHKIITETFMQSVAQAMISTDELDYNLDYCGYDIIAVMYSANDPITTALYSYTFQYPTYRSLHQLYSFFCESRLCDYVTEKNIPEDVRSAIMDLARFTLHLKIDFISLFNDFISHCELYEIEFVGNVMIMCNKLYTMSVSAFKKMINKLDQVWRKVCDNASVKDLNAALLQYSSDQAKDPVFKLCFYTFPMLFKAQGEISIEQLIQRMELTKLKGVHDALYIS